MSTANRTAETTEANTDGGYVHLRPDYRIIIDGNDINPRLLSLGLSESRSEEADQLDISLRDEDGALELPRKGVTLDLALGFAGSELVDKGAFVVDEVEHSGPPDQISIRARSANFTNALRRRREQSWHAQTLGAIVQTIAARNSLKTRVDAALATQSIAHIDQSEESDIAFIARLGQRFDAVATVKNSTLIFLTVNNTTTSKGQKLPTQTIVRTDTQMHRYSSADRDSYTGVRAFYGDTAAAERPAVLVGTDENPKELPDTYANRKEAQDEAASEWQRIERSSASLSLDLATGRPELMPQTPVQVRGFKTEINDTLWMIIRISHSLNNSGFITSLELEKLARG